MKALAGYIGLLVVAVVVVATVGFVTRLLAEALLFGWGVLG